MPDIEIKRRIDFGVIKLHQYVVTGNPQLGGSKATKVAASKLPPDQIKLRITSREP